MLQCVPPVAKGDALRWPVPFRVGPPTLGRLTRWMNYANVSGVAPICTLKSATPTTPRVPEDKPTRLKAKSGSEFSTEEIPFAHPAGAIATMASTNKCLAQMNKSDTAGKATKKARNPASRVDPMGADHLVVPAIKQAFFNVAAAMEPKSHVNFERLQRTGRTMH